MQTTANLLMIRPVQFSYNAETAVNNSFQVAEKSGDIQQKGLQEFDDFVEKILANNIDVTVINDTPEPHTPDSIFPNNWISFHDNGTIVLYPMFAENRRAERKQNIVETISKKFLIEHKIDLTPYEHQHVFLEGTGSMVLDRENKIAYACVSPRTNQKVLEDFCKKMNYASCTFTATDENDDEIYHTNVMMSVADKYVIICLESIKKDSERRKIEEQIRQTNKKIILVSIVQMSRFACNLLQVENKNREKFLLLSTQAFHSLNPKQVSELEQFNRLIYSNLKTIETNGGGSARCMVAEIFLKRMNIM